MPLLRNELFLILLTEGGTTNSKAMAVAEKQKQTRVKSQEILKNESRQGKQG